MWNNIVMSDKIYLYSIFYGMLFENLWNHLAILVVKGRICYFVKWHMRSFNPSTAGAAYIRVFIFY